MKSHSQQAFADQMSFVYRSVLHTAATKSNLCFVEKLELCKLQSQHLKDLKTSDVQDADERRPLPFGPVQRLVDAMDEPTEQPLICRLGQSLNGKVGLR